MKNASISPDSHGPTTSEVELLISKVGNRLSNAVCGILDSLPERPKRIGELAKLLGLRRDVTSRVLNATQMQDPIAVSAAMPGPEALQMLIRAARQQNIDQKRIEAAENAVREFADLLRDLGGRSELDAIISKSLPETRQRFELSHKQAVFKGMSHLKGISTDVAITTVLAYPTGDGTHWDSLSIVGSVGLRRLRPGAPIHFSSAVLGPERKGMVDSTLDGLPVDAEQASFLLTKFCTQPVPSLTAQITDDIVRYTVDGDCIGPRSCVTLYLAQLNRKLTIGNPGNTPRRKGASAEVEVPARELVFDLLIHRTLWPSLSPELIIYDTTIHGAVDMNDRSRDIDTLDLAESIQPLGVGLGQMRIAEVANYSDMLRYVCKELDWDDAAFRGYRCRVRYPPYGSQFAMVFDVPHTIHSVIH